MLSAPPPLNRRTSTASGAALSLLDALEAEIANLEAQNAALERLVAEAGENPGEEGVAVLIEKRNELRQHCGNLEKFQTVKVDSVVTAELNTGKDEAKQRRKSVNARCEALRERQAGLMGKMQTIIKRSA
ncbi:hypothetical protein TeGR_g751 [Tetraparma gracilis]|uniref:Uncharacterized protein n=1 Tax=Tetraparma gracilis TaxID=2962635 RepID=A0ABQ6MGN9_9STRA|nr:hypothetical protein TeGR_g751 [Tetraparma gracilis]